MKKLMTVLAIALFTLGAHAQETKPAKCDKAKKECCAKKAADKKACCAKKK